jgi:hypothetical protein
VQSSIVLETIDEKEGRTEDATIKSQTFNRQADQNTRLKKKNKYKPGPVSAHPNLAGLS